MAHVGQASSLPIELEGWKRAPLRDPRTKLLVTQRLLHVRRRLSHLWAQGDYVPLEVSGLLADHIVAFGWRGAESQRIELLAAVPRFVQKLIDAERASGTENSTSQFPLPPGIWDGNFIVLPAGSNFSATNVFTGQSHVLAEPAVAAGVLLADFPIGVLETSPS